MADLILFAGPNGQDIEVSAANPLPVTGGGGGAVDQGTSGSDPWQFDLREVGGTSVTLGQKTMAASLPVVIASDQAAIPVSISGSATALTPTSNQVNIAATGVAVALSPVPFQLDTMHIIAKLTNGANIFLGGSTVTSANGLILEPGRGVTLENIDVNTIYINGTAADGISAFALT